MPDRKLIDYIPPVLQGVMEFAAIADAQQPEIDAAWDALAFVMDNQFIDTATAAGVAVWEKELGIVPLAADTLEDRKQRVKAAWTYGVVYTYNWLVTWLKTFCGDSNPPPVINDYTLRVSLPVTVDYQRMLDDMRRYISANMLINPLILLSKNRMPHYTGTALRFSTKQTLTTDTWDTDSINLLADEDGAVLLDVNNTVLYEEVITDDT